MLPDKPIFLSVKSSEDLKYCLEWYTPDVISFDPFDKKLKKKLEKEGIKRCSRAPVKSDAAALALINDGFSYSVTNNTNIHILKNNLIYPCSVLSTAIRYIELGVRNILWLGTLSDAKYIKDQSVNVYHYVQDNIPYSNLDKFDYADGLWFNLDHKFLDFIKGQV